MKKSEFLTKLERLLQSYDKKEREKTLSYYGEMIEDFIEDGYKEEEAVQKVGSPGEIAEQLLSDDLAEEKKQVTKGTKFVIGLLLVLGCPLWGSLVLAGICLLISAFLLILSGYILIWCIPVITGSLAISSVLVSVVSTVGAFFLFPQNMALGFVQLGIGILAAGLFIILGFLTIWASKYFIKVTKQFSEWIYTVGIQKWKGVKAWKR